MLARTSVLLLLATSFACGEGDKKDDAEPSKPGKAQIQLMPLADQCKALGEKLDPCGAEYIKESMKALGTGDQGMGQLQKLVAKKLDKQGKKAKVMCKASPAKRMVTAVLTCWDKTDCRDLAACVIHQENLIAARERRERGIAPKREPGVRVKVRSKE